MRTTAARLLYALLLALTLGFGATARSEFPPKGFKIEEDTLSPNEKYAVLIPKREGDEPTEFGDHVTNYVADVAAKKTLGTIKLGAYFEGANRRGLVVEWAPDSTWCAVEYEGRWGFDTISIVEIANGKLTPGQLEIGQRMQKALDAETSRQTKHKTSCEVVAYLRAGEDHKLRVRGVSTNDPKMMGDTPAALAYFQGTYDVSAKKWIVTDTRPLKDEAYNALQDAFQAASDSSSSLTPEQVFEGLDKQLNAVYQALKFILPQARFAMIKLEQVAWLKGQKENATPAEKVKPWVKRIEALQEYLW